MLYFHSSSPLNYSTDSQSNFSSKLCMEASGPVLLLQARSKRPASSGPCWVLNIPKQRDAQPVSYLMLQHPQDENLHQGFPQCSLIHCPLPSTRDLWEGSEALFTPPFLQGAELFQYWIKQMGSNSLMSKYPGRWVMHCHSLSHLSGVPCPP